VKGPWPAAKGDLEQASKESVTTSEGNGRSKNKRGERAATWSEGEPGGC
jgi:hypothetical protein